MSRKHKRHAEEDPDPEFQVAPMVDVLLVLLMFFMSITSTEVMKKVQELELPEARNFQESGPMGEGGEVVINVAFVGADKPPSISVDTLPKTIEQLGPVMAERKAKFPKIRVLVRADGRIEYRTLAEIMKAVGASQIQNITYAVITAKDKPAAGPAATP